MTPESRRCFSVSAPRRLAAGLLGATACLIRACRRKRIAPGEAGDVVVIEPYGMGDLLACKPLIEALAEREFRVHICARTAWKPLFDDVRLQSWIESRVPWSAYDLSGKYAPGMLGGRAFRSFFAELKQIAPRAVGVDPRGDIRSVLLLWLAGFAEVYSFSHYVGSDLRLFPGSARTVAADTNMPKWKLNLRLLEPLGIGIPPGVRRPTVTGTAPAPSTRPGARVGLVAVAPWPGRCWSAAAWREFVVLAGAAGFDLAGFCGPRQRAEAGSMLGPGVSVTECSAVADWIANLSTLDAVVSINSGPMHLAEALGKPVVLIDGPAVLPLWGTTGPSSRTLHHQDAVSCAPCHQVGRCRRPSDSCLARVRPGEVLDALRECLDASGPGPRAPGACPPP